MLKQALSAQRKQLEALANVWLAGGATGYAIVDIDGRVAMQWPKGALAVTLRVPILRRRKTLGYLWLSGLDDALSQERLSAEAQLIAQFIQLDHDLCQLTQEVVTRQDELVAMLELTQSTRNQLDIEQLIPSVLQQVTRLFDCESAFLTIELPDAIVKPFYQYPKPLITEDVMLGWLQTVHQDGREQVVNNSANLPKEVFNLLTAPLTIRGEAIAAIGLVNKRDGDFTYPNRKLLSAIAQQVAAQVENALLYAESIQQEKRKHEYALARDVQMHLLPNKAPLVPYVEVAASSRPAREVGGDFFDYLPSNDGELRFSVGDVSGKGMPAAMLMGMSHTTLSSAARFLADPSPAAILDHANKSLYDDFTEVSMFATVFVGHYDSSFRTITFANAGHSPVFYCPVDGEAVMLEADGTALGILTWCLSEDHSLVLGDGDLLVVASDGLPEAQNAVGEMFGYERLQRLIEHHRGESAENLLKQLLDAVKQFSGDTEQDDDETIMILKGVA